MTFRYRSAAALCFFAAICVGDDAILSPHEDTHETEPSVSESSRLKPKHWAESADYDMYLPHVNVNSTEYQNKLKVFEERLTDVAERATKLEEYRQAHGRMPVLKSIFAEHMHQLVVSFFMVSLGEFGKLRADGEFAEIHGDFVYYTKFFRSVSYLDQHVVDVLYEKPRFVVNNQGLPYFTKFGDFLLGDDRHSTTSDIAEVIRITQRLHTHFKCEEPLESTEWAHRFYDDCLEYSEMILAKDASFYDLRGSLPSEVHAHWEL